MLEWSALFPTKGSFITFSLYIILFVFHGVFVTASKSLDNSYNYDPATVVFASELLKLCASAVLYTYYQGDKPHLIKAIGQNFKLLLLYFVPSLLYCFYNNLAFVNLSHYDPTTYLILLQLRVVLTGFLYQCLFSRVLSKVQWISLVILTVGCMIKNLDVRHADVKGFETNIWSDIFSIYTISINVQNFCSCLAGTYNEYLLKTQGSDVDIFLQNVFMYLDSVFCNFLILLFKRPDRIRYIFDYNDNKYVYPIIVTSAVVGIVTSFFLKNLNSIMKTYASALELMISAIVCSYLFNIKITVFTVVSISLVVIAVAMYLKNPVSSSTASTNDKESTKHLLEVVSQD